MLFNSKQEKLTEKAFTQSIAISVFSILLCIIALCSVPWAWFSDGISSPTNSIQSAAFTDIKFAGATTIEAKGDGRLSFVDCEFNVAPKKYNGFSRAAAIIGANQYYTIDLYLEGCTFNYQYTTGDADLWNAAIFMWSNVNDCKIKNCTFNGYGFMAVKLMNVAEGAEIVLDGNTFNMCEASAANYFNNDAVQIMPQHDNTFSVVCTNNTFNGAYDQNTVVDIEGMSGLTLTKYTLTQSGNTINGEAATDANFEIQ